MLPTLERIDSPRVELPLTEHGIAMDIVLLFPESPLERGDEIGFVVSPSLRVIIAPSHTHLKDIFMPIEVMTCVSFKLNHPDRPSSILPASIMSNHRLGHDLESLHWVAIGVIANMFFDSQTANLLDCMAKAYKEMDISLPAEDLPGAYLDMKTLKSCLTLHVSGNNFAMEPPLLYLEDFFRGFARLLEDSTRGEDVLIVDVMELLEDALGNAGPNEAVLVKKTLEDGRTAIDDSSEGAKGSSRSDV
jgi:hypothetical protein